MSDLPTTGVKYQAAGVEEFIGDNKRAAGSVDDFTDKAQKSSTESSKHFSAIGEAAKAGMKLVAGAMVAGAVAVGAFLTDSVGTAMDFEKQMSGVQAVLQATPEQANALREAALDIGATTSKSASEAAEAFEMLGQNGVDTEAILNGLGTATVALSEATGGDLATSADVASTAMDIWKISAEDMEAAINGITGVTIKSKFGIDDYRLAMAQGGGAAAAFGVDLEDFNTTITATSSLFSSGGDAGTSFKTFLTTLVPKSKEAEAAMRDLGIITADGANQFFNADGSMKDMAEIAGVLDQALAGLSEEQKNAALSTIFGSDAMRTAIGLAETGEEGFRDLNTAIGETSAADQAKIRMDNLSGSLEAAKGAFETLQINIGSALIPVLKDLLDNIITPLINTASELFGVIDEGKDPVEAITAEFPELAGVIEFAGEAFQFLKEIVDAVLPPIMELALQVIGAIASFWKANGEDIMATAKETWNTVAEIIKTVVQIITVILKAISAFMRDHSSEIQAVMTAAWTIIKTVIETAVNTVKGLVEAALSLMKGDVEGAMSAIKGIFQTQWEGAVTIVKTLLGDLPGKVKGWVDETVSAAKEVGSGIIEGIRSGISGGLEAIRNAAIDAAKSALKAAKDFLGIKSPSKAFTEVGTDSDEGWAQGITKSASKVVQATREVAAQVYSSAASPTLAMPSMAPAYSSSDVNVYGNVGVDLSMAPGLTNLIDARIRAADISTANAARNRTPGRRR